MYWECLRTYEVAGMRGTGWYVGVGEFEHMWLAVRMCMDVRASNSVGTSLSEKTNFSPGTVKSELHS